MIEYLLKQVQFYFNKTRVWLLRLAYIQGKTVYFNLILRKASLSNNYAQQNFSWYSWNKSSAMECFLSQPLSWRHRLFMLGTNDFIQKGIVLRLMPILIQNSVSQSLSSLDPLLLQSSNLKRLQGVKKIHCSDKVKLLNEANILEHK